MCDRPERTLRRLELQFPTLVRSFDFATRARADLTLLSKSFGGCFCFSRSASLRMASLSPLLVNVRAVKKTPPVHPHPVFP